ncbi:MAG: hypothetical protein R6X20_15030 [Phycisphaerae bacterium]
MRILTIVLALAAWVPAARAAVPEARPERTISLAGEWAFRLDPRGVGEKENWAAEDLPRRISLPGSTDEAGYGEPLEKVRLGSLNRPVTYRGPAWYQKRVIVPEGWAGRRVRLFLERCHWKTTVWVDGKEVGSRDSLSVPHVYDLTAHCPPGPHRLTVCVDNRIHVRVGHAAHSITDGTQTNWNGIVGRMDLSARDPVWIEDVRVAPDLANRSAEVRLRLRNATGKPAEGRLVLTAVGTLDRTTHTPAPVTRTVRIAGDAKTVTVPYPLGEDALVWDEWQPALYTLRTVLETGTDGRPYRDEQTAAFGLREMAVRGRQFRLNGRPFFLRGTLECCIFPRTGYPDMEGDRWRHIMRTAKTYGLNHLRFHSWCPPEAAFVAADREGITLQVELPVWSNDVGKNDALNAYMAEEGRRILHAYGNHPSFTMLCLGNELHGDWGFMDRLLADFKAADPRRLYTFSADYRRKEPGPTSDYYVTHTTQKGRVRMYGGRMFQPPTTDQDWAEQRDLYDVPLVAHELGQWSVYPDFSKIPKYTGVLRPDNLRAYRHSLRAHGMWDQRHRFHQASGRFAWLVYKEDMESCLRTPDVGGFQLLDLHDFPGQGTALVGLLDVFWDPKGLVPAERFRRFCAPTVVLLRMKTFTWTTDGEWSAAVDVAHYGREALKGQTARWTVRDTEGKELASGTLPAADLPVGEVTRLGEIAMPLDKVREAAQCRVEVVLGDGLARNGWDFWVYPADLAPEKPAGVTVRHGFDDETRRLLAEGKKVLLLKTEGETMQPMDFFPVFWTYHGFTNAKWGRGGGILCDPDHPALAAFPTEFHSNWQWYGLTRRARCFDLDRTPHAFRPLVQFIDDFHRNLKLGVVFEARVGPGRLLACAVDLESDLDGRPVARRMLHSLYRYMASPAFAPEDELDPAVLAEILK